MTEAEWLECRDPKLLLDQVRGKVSDRKLRLFAVACCRGVWSLLSDRRTRQAVELAERFADGLATFQELEAAHADCQRAVDECKRLSSSGFLDVSFHAARSALSAAFNPAALIAPRKSLGRPPRGAPVEPILPRDIYPAYAADSAASARGAAKGGRNEAAVEIERTAQAQLARDIVGNPFQPNSSKRRKWTPAVLRHAKALYQGEDSVAELRNALAKMGEAELAEHFETHDVHPKGCWVVDYILGKE